MIPAALVGFFFESQIEQLFDGQIAFVGAMLIVTAGLLWLADKSKNTLKKVNYSKRFCHWNFAGCGHSSRYFQKWCNHFYVCIAGE